MAAIMKGGLEIVQLLLNNKADLNLKEKNGETAAMLAHEKRHTNIVKILVEASLEQARQTKKPQ